MKTIRSIAAGSPHRLPARLKLVSTRLGSLILLFQRMPVVQFLFPEANIIGGASVANTISLAVTTVVGLGVYDSVAGATATITQLSPISSPTEKQVPAVVGLNLNFSFKCNAPSPAYSWACSPNPPAPGLVHTNITFNDIDSITGIPTTAGQYPVDIEVWGEESSHYKKQAFTIYVLGFTTQPASQTIPSNTTVNLTCAVTGVPTGVTPTYQWYQGTSDTIGPVLGTSSSFTTPALTSTTSYWVKVTSVLGPSTLSVSSNTATVNVTPVSSPFDTWASGLAPLNGPMDIPQGDGVTNLMKYACNLNPLAPDVSKLTVGGSETKGLPVQLIVGGKLRMEFLRRKASTNPGITYFVEFSSDMGGASWSSQNVSTLPLGSPVGTDWERVEVDDFTGTARFGRVKVVKTP